MYIVEIENDHYALLIEKHFKNANW